MNPPTLIVVAGVSASGKSTVGAALAQQIGYAFFDGDDFHSADNKVKMGRGEPLNDEDRRPWLNQLAALWQNNPDKKMVIACSALKREYRKILLGTSTTHNPNPSRKVVLLQVPREVLLSRTANRQGHFAKANLIESQLATLEVPEKAEDEPDLLLVDGTLPVEGILREIEEKLGFHV